MTQPNDALREPRQEGAFDAGKLSAQIACKVWELSTFESTGRQELTTIIRKIIEATAGQAASEAQPHFSDDVTTYSSFGDAYNQGYQDGKRAQQAERDRRVRDSRCDFYFGGIDGGNRCQKPLGHPDEEGHEWRAALEDAGKVSGGEEKE